MKYKCTRVCFSIIIICERVSNLSSINETFLDLRILLGSGRLWTHTHAHAFFPSRTWHFPGKTHRRPKCHSVQDLCAKHDTFTIRHLCCLGNARVSRKCRVYMQSISTQETVTLLTPSETVTLLCVFIFRHGLQQPTTALYQPKPVLEFTFLLNLLSLYFKCFKSPLKDR